MPTSMAARVNVAIFVMTTMGVVVAPATVSAEANVRMDADTHRAMTARAGRVPAQAADDHIALPAEPPAQSGAAGGPVAPRSADVFASFVGLDRASAMNNGVAFESANVSIARSGLFHVFEAANSAIRMLVTSGAVVQTKDLNSFFGTSTLNGRLFNPKVYFDRIGTRPRVYVAALQQQSGSTEATRLSTLWLAVSRSSGPFNLDPQSWCFYQFNAKRNAKTSLSSAALSLGLGGGRDALVVTTNQFTFTGGAFTFAIIRAFRTDVLSNNGPVCPSVQPVLVSQASITAHDDTTFALQPVHHHSRPVSFAGTTNPVYLVNTRNGASNIYRLWQVRNVASTPSVRNVTLAGSFTYDGFANDPSQTGTSIRIEAGTTGITSAAAVGDGRISAVHSTRCTSGGVSFKWCFRVVRIQPGQTSAGSLTAVLDQQRTFGGYGQTSFFKPTISVNVWGQRAVAFSANTNGISQFLSSYWTLSDRDTLHFPSASLITPGNCALPTMEPDYRLRRAGSLAAELDPSDNTTFWLAGVRARTLPCQWESQILQVNPGTEGIIGQ